MPDSEESDPRLLRIAGALLQQTRMGMVEWERTMFRRSEAFIYSTEYTTVMVRAVVSEAVKSTSSDADYPVEMLVLDSNGVVLESIGTGANLTPADETLLRILLRVARRDALRVNDKLDQLLAELGLEQ